MASTTLPFQPFHGAFAPDLYGENPFFNAPGTTSPESSNSMPDESPPSSAGFLFSSGPTSASSTTSFGSYLNPFSPHVLMPPSQPLPVSSAAGPSSSVTSNLTTALPNRQRSTSRHASPSAASTSSAQSGPGVQFITATNPKQFREKATMKRVRSHVMLDYGSRKDQTEDGRIVKRKRAKRSPTQAGPSARARYISNSESDGSSSSETALVPGLSSLKRYTRAIGRMQAQGVPLFIPKLHPPEYGTGFESVMDSLGVDLDPFRALPRSDNPNVSVPKLKHHCSKMFGTKTMGQEWLPEVLKSRAAFLGTLAIASAHHDAMYDQVEDTYVTRAIKTEVVHLIYEEMQAKNQQASDMTILAILHLLTSEIISADEEVLKIHEEGIRAMVRNRGGLAKLGVGGKLAAFVTAMSFCIGIFGETQPDRMYKEAIPIQVTQLPNDKLVPESPLYRPHDDFIGIVHSSRCKPQTWELLSDMHELTDLFIRYHRPRRQGSGFDLAPKELQKRFDDCKRDVNARLAALPKATDATSDVYEDWNYEACRMVAELFTYAVTNNVPFSEAAAALDPPATDLFLTSAPFAATGTVPHPTNIHPTAEPHTPRMAPRSSWARQLKEVLIRSQVTDCWGNMAGVLFWVVLIGTGAARGAQRHNRRLSSTTVVSGRRVDIRKGADDDVRRWLAAYSVRCCIVLGFTHPNEILGAMRRLIRVQELLQH